MLSLTEDESKGGKNVKGRNAGRWGIGVLLWYVTLGTVAGWAQEAAPAAEAPAKPSPWSPVEAVGLAAPLKDFGLEIHGLVAGNWTWNFNNPANGKNGLLLMNRREDQMALDLANIRIQRNVDGGINFVTDLNFGQTAEVVGRTTRWCSNPRCGMSRDSFDISQAYLSYKFPIGEGLTVKAGKWVTLHGAEVIKTWDNINYNISNSILFGYSIPFTHTGLLLNYPFFDWLSMDAGFIVGWDDVYNNNDGYSGTGGLTILPPIDNLTLYLAETFGPEQNDGGYSTRLLFTALATYKPIDRWTFILDFNNGNESNIVAPCNPSGRCTKDARWTGLAGYVIYQFTDKLTGTLRSEFFDDVDGVRTGTKQTLWEITPTLTYEILPGLKFRAEYRHDESDKRFFQGVALTNPSPDGPTTRLFQGQDTVAWEFSYSF